MDDFIKPKLMYSEIVQDPHFYYDENIHFYPEATTFIMNGHNLKSLLLILNSSIVFALFKLFYAGGGLGENGVRYKKAFLLNLRLPKLNDISVEKFNSYFELLKTNNFSIHDNKNVFENIEIYICELYGFSKEEMQYLLNLNKVF